MKLDISVLFKAYHIPVAIPEHMFHPARRWRFDYAWPDKKVAMEIEGGIWIYGRHNHAKGYLADLEKYNAAAELGWRVFRYQPDSIDFQQLQIALS